MKPLRETNAVGIEQKATKETKEGMHPLFQRADSLSTEVIGAAIDVHREIGPGLLESIYERCLLHELALRDISATTQKLVQIVYKGLILQETLRFDVLVADCLLIEVKAVECVLPVHKAQLLTYMKLLNVPLGLLLNFHEAALRHGVNRLMLPGANIP